MSDAAEERELLQQRLVLFGQLTVAMCVFFYVVSQIAIYFGLALPWLLMTHVVIGIEATLGLVSWLYCRGPHRQLDALRRLELALSFAVLQSTWIIAATLPIEPGMRVPVMLLGFNLGVYIRSVFIPSSATRMALLGGTAALPLIIYSFFTMPVRYAFWTIPWCVSGVGVATLGAWVIYGLRCQAAHARRLGQYTLEQKLGAGGMGVVYRASHAMLRRPTAVKLLRAEKAGEQALLRFEREVQRTAQLSHPNTVSIYDFGRTPEGVFYYAMEYLDGIDLQNLVDGDGAQLPERVVHILRQVLGALDGSARRRTDPSRHQAGQHHPVRAGRSAGRGQGRRLRPGQGARYRGRPEPRRRARRNTPLHGSRVDPFRRCRPPLRYLCRRRGRLLPADGLSTSSRDRL